MSGTPDPELTSRWSRRFVLVGAGFLVLVAVADLLDAGRRALVVLGVLGFVLHTVFGKAYSLLPTYFDRQFGTPSVMPVHLGLATGGTALLALDALGVAGDRTIELAGATAWLGGVLVFVGAIAWTVRDNPTGRETGTGDANAHRRRLDRVANGAMPAALLYLVAGTLALVGRAAGIGGGLGTAPVASHLLAAGTATLLVLAVGFRLLPRFLVVEARSSVAAAVLAAGSVGPAVLASGMTDRGPLFHAGAVLEAVAVVGFAVAITDMFRRSDRRRVGLVGVMLGSLAGIAGVLVGLDMAVGSGSLALAPVHVRLNVLGFLGLTIIGVSYQFYPPNAGSFRLATDRTAWLVLGAVSTGLVLHAAVPATGGAVGDSVALLAGGAITVGAVAHFGLLAGLFRERYGGRS